MLNDDAVRQWDFGSIAQTYTSRDTILYALGIGMGSDPLDEGELRFVFEKELQAVPTMATVLGSPGFWWRDPRTGADWVKLVHGEQDLRLLRPLPSAATVIAVNRVVSITDKGEGKGAIAVIERELVEQDSGATIAKGRNVTFLRGDGGYSKDGRGHSDPGPDPLPSIPDRPADIEISLPTLERQALLYRLSGDYNVLHADPAVAKAAGFSRPILHGLCTYGMAAHALLKMVCRYDAARVSRVATRFTAPVTPGETIRFQFWEKSDGVFHLRALIDSRNATVLNNGIIELC